MKKLKGSCLCGAVTFEVNDEFKQFQLCHCIQCQKSTGSGNASNLLSSVKSITWHSGEELIVRYDLEGRSISNAFCGKCGSRVPYVSQSGELLVTPAGLLDEAPTILPQGNIFWPERAEWYDQAALAKPYDKFIE
jgi:hypothetical protein